MQMICSNVKEYGVEKPSSIIDPINEWTLSTSKDLPDVAQILNENELKRVTNLDFQTLDVDKAAETEYLALN